MKLFLVASSGWGIDIAIVRAEDAAHAKKLANVISSSCKVVELSAEGSAEVLWEYDYTPDTGDGGCGF